MATFLDLSLVGFFGKIFIFLFIFAITWGLLSFFKIFKSIPGENGINGLIAISMALFVTISGDTSYLIATMVPWFAVLMIFLFLLFMIFRMFSGEDDSLMVEAIKSPGVYWTVIIIGIIILIASLSSTFGQRLLDDDVDAVPVNIDERNELIDGTDIPIIDSDREPSENTNTVNSGTVGAPGSTATDDFDDNVLATIVHPKVMGLIMLMFIAFFAVLLIARTPDPDS